MKRARASSYRVRSIQKSGFSKTVSKRLVLVVRRSSSNGPVSCRLVSVYSRARRVASASAFGNAPGAARVASPRPDAFFFFRFGVVSCFFSDASASASPDRRQNAKRRGRRASISATRTARRRTPRRRRTARPSRTAPRPGASS